MKRIFIIVSLVSISVFGCSKNNLSGSVNSENTNLQSASNTETNQEIAAKTSDAPVTVFTDANEALTAGNKFFDQSDNEKAVGAYRQAVKLNPDFADAYFKLGMAYSLLEKEQKDAGVLTEEPTAAAKKGKKDVPVKLTDSDKAFENAVKAYKKILDKDPKDDVAKFNLGRAFNKLNQDTDAQKALSEAVKLNPDDGEYQTEYGAILIKLAKYEDAIAPLKKAVELDADNLQAQELLEKAQAGKKRIDFGIKPKLEELAQQQQEQQQTKKRENPKQSANSNSQENSLPPPPPPPQKKNSNQ